MEFQLGIHFPKITPTDVSKELGKYKKKCEKHVRLRAKGKLTKDLNWKVRGGSCFWLKACLQKS